MSISIQCPSCSKKLKAKEDLAGKRVKCPGCGHAVLIPPLQANSESNAASKTIHTSNKNPPTGCELAHQKAVDFEHTSTHPAAKTDNAPSPIRLNAQAGRNAMRYGVLLCIIGIMLTVMANVGYALEGASKYGIVLGPILAGGFLVLYGFFQSADAKKRNTAILAFATDSHIQPRSDGSIQSTSHPASNASILKRYPGRVIAVSLISWVVGSAVIALFLSMDLLIPAVLISFPMSFGFTGIPLALLAARKNRNGWVWGIVGGFLPSAGICAMVLMFMPFLCPYCHAPISDKDWRKKRCPVCGDIN